jgi:hypothetical protein
VVVCDLEVAAYVEAGWHGGCWFGGSVGTETSQCIYLSLVVEGSPDAFVPTET